MFGDNFKMAADWRLSRKLTYTYSKMQLANSPRLRRVLIPLAFYVVFTAIVSGLSDDNTEKMERHLAEGSRPFRMQKINDIWSKAQKKLPEMKIKRLYKDLQMQDDLEIKWKKLKAHGGDNDGEIEAKNRRTLFKILEYHGLKEHFPYDDEIIDNRSSKQKFGDKKVDSLWEEAKKRGDFNAQELDDLKIELTHYKQKIDEYNLVQDSIQDDISENSVMRDKELTDIYAEKLKRKLREKQKDIHLHYSNLEVKVRGEKTQSEFDDPRLNDLWERALQGDFTDEEKVSIKEELQHFERKIKKHDNIQEQVDVAEKLLAEGNTHIQQKHDRLQNQLKDGKKYVKKMHQHMMDKVTKKEEL